MLNHLVFLQAFILLGASLFYLSLSRRGWKILGYRPLILVTALPAFCLLAPSIWLVYLACIAAIPILARNGRQIIPLYLLALFVLPELTTPQALPPLKLNNLNVPTCLALGALLAVPIRRAKFHKGFYKADIPFIVLFCILAFIMARETSATNVLRIVIDLFLLIGLPYGLASRLVRDSDDLKILTLHLALAGAILASILICEAILKWPIYRFFYEHLGIQLSQGQSVKTRAGLLRATGPFIEATSAAFCLMFTLFAAWLNRQAFRSALMHAAIVSFLLVAMLAPQSRGAWLGLGVGVAVAWLYRRGGPSLAFLAFATGAAAFIAAVTMPVLSDDADRSQLASDTIEYRKLLLIRGLEEFTKTPFTGDNRLSLENRLGDLRQGEGIIDYVNTYLWVALHAGAFGLLLFVAAPLSRIFALWRARRLLAPNDASLMSGALFFAGLVAPVEMLAFTSLGGRPEILLFVFLGLSSALLIDLDRGTVGKRRIKILLQPVMWDKPIRPGADPEMAIATNFGEVQHRAQGPAD